MEVDVLVNFQSDELIMLEEACMTPSMGGKLTSVLRFG